MKLTRVFCFLIILFGSSAVAAHAQTPVDPTIIWHGSPCVPGDFCIGLTYSGPTVLCVLSDCHVLGSGLPGTNDPPLVFASNPPVGGAVLFPLPPTFSCEAVDLPGILVATYSGVSGPPPPITGTFEGCTYIGLLFGGTSTTINSNGPVSLVLPPDVCVTGTTTCAGDTIDLAPEPSSSVLFMSGLILFCLGGFARKRFGSNFPT